MSDVTMLTTQLQKLIESSNIIYIACHSSPDPDALGSMLALQDILETNFGKRNVKVFAETLSHSLMFLPGYENVDIRGIYNTAQNGTPDLIIFLDFNMWHMVSPKAAIQMKDLVIQRQINTVVIDHHPQEIKNVEATLYINHNDSSTCQTLFRIFGDELKLDLSQKACDNLLAGIISDTERFKYHHSSLSYTFSILPAILEKASFDIESLTQIMTRFPKGAMKSLETFIQNTVTEDSGLTYTTIRDQDVTDKGLSKTDISSAAKFYMSHLLLNIDDSVFGFVIYPYIKEPGVYTVSLRSTNSVFNVRKIGEALGGGGHEKSSAARIKAQNSEEALAIVLTAVQSLKY